MAGRDAAHAGVAQSVERNLAKVEVAGSNPVTRSDSNHTLGAWLSPVERCVRDAEVPGSNPGAPIRLDRSCWLGGLLSQLGHPCRPRITRAAEGGRSEIRAPPRDRSRGCFLPSPPSTAPAVTSAEPVAETFPRERLPAIPAAGGRSESGRPYPVLEPRGRAPNGSPDAPDAEHRCRTSGKSATGRASGGNRGNLPTHRPAHGRGAGVPASIVGQGARRMASRYAPCRPRDSACSRLEPAGPLNPPHADRRRGPLRC